MEKNILGPGGLDLNDSGGSCGNEIDATPQEEQDMLDWARKMRERSGMFLLHMIPGLSGRGSRP